MSALLLMAATVRAHPVPKDAHDRAVALHFQDGANGQVLVRLSYRLEVDEVTVIQDMQPFRDEVDAGLYVNKPLEYYREYARIFGGIIGRKLEVELRQADQKNLLPLKLSQHTETLKEDAIGPDHGKPLGHLRCTFVFETAFAPTPGSHEFLLRDFNFRDDLQGKIVMAFANDATLKITRQVVPDPELNKLHFSDRPSEFDRKMRQLAIDFTLPESAEAKTPIAAPEENLPREEKADHDDEFLQTFRELRQSQTGLVLMLLIFAGLGAAHALTPGHGKTLVAAYLVGEHGTFWHALTLGLVTTVTHTGVVLVIALVLFFLPESTSGEAKHAIQTGLGLVLGISVTCLGFWLLLKRLSGGADHIHLSSSGTKGRLSWWGIIVLGVNGGLIPCWDAVAILVAVIGSSEFWLALPALLAFSAGLAAVLVLIGVMVVQFRNFAGSRWGEGRIIRSLPIVSALLVAGMGVYLCFASMRP